MEHLFGIAGIGKETEEKIIKQLQQRTNQFRFHCDESYIETDIRLLAFSNAAKSVCSRIHDDGRRVLGWVGHVVVDGLNLWPEAQELLNTIDGDVCLSMAQTDGLYALAIHDKVGQKLILATDRYGIWPLYYMKLGKGVVFSTSLDLLAYAAPDLLHLNPHAAAEYLHLHYCLGDKTLVKEISRLTQGSLANFNLREGGHSKKEYFNYKELPCSEDEEETISVSDLSELLSMSVLRRLKHDKEIVCLLSSGYDSRTLSGLLVRHKVPFYTLTTYGDTGALDDPEGARLVADALDLENTYFPLPRDYLQLYWKAKCLATDFATTMHTWLMPLTQRHRHPGAVNYDGIAGGIALKGALVRQSDLDLLEQGDTQALVDAMMTLHSSGRVLDRAISEPFRKQWKESVRSALEEEVLLSDNHPNSLSFFVFRNRTRRAISASPCCLLSNRLENVAPFFDFQFFNAAMSIPPASKIGGRVYKEMIKNVDFRLSDIPSSNDKNWPDNMPRRRKPLMCVASPEAIISYLDEIEGATENLPDLIDRKWLSDARKAADSDHMSRLDFLREAQALGELAFWVSTYLQAPEGRPQASGVLPAELPNIGRT